LPASIKKPLVKVAEDQLPREAGCSGKNGIKRTIQLITSNKKKGTLYMIQGGGGERNSAAGGPPHRGKMSRRESGLSLPNRKDRIKGTKLRNNGREDARPCTVGHGERGTVKESNSTNGSARRIITKLLWRKTARYVTVL